MFEEKQMPFNLTKSYYIDLPILVHETPRELCYENSETRNISGI